MDPVTHTLVGATVAETGLKRQTALGTAALVIGANLPDVDVLASLDGPVTALWCRRGLTHGVLAWLVLPFLLTGLLLLWDRFVRRRGARRGDPPARALSLLFLSAVGVATHPVLDLLNTYGIRLLMPFSARWFYGDTLFIADPWIWLVLATAYAVARRRPAAEGTSGARRSGSAVAAAALGAVVTYAAIMALSNVVIRADVTRTLVASGVGAPERLMVAPVPVTPFRREVVAEVDGRYHFGTYRLIGRRRFELHALTRDREPTDPGAAAATRGPEVRKFLSWARFPYFVTDQRGGAVLVHIGDARYTLDPRGSWAGMTVPITR